MEFEPPCARFVHHMMILLGPTKCRHTTWFWYASVKRKRKEETLLRALNQLCSSHLGKGGGGGPLAGGPARGDLEMEVFRQTSIGVWGWHVGSWLAVFTLICRFLVLNLFIWRRGMVEGFCLPSEWVCLLQFKSTIGVGCCLMYW